MRAWRVRELVPGGRWVSSQGCPCRHAPASVLLKISGLSVCPHSKPAALMAWLNIFNRGCHRGLGAWEARGPLCHGHGWRMGTAVTAASVTLPGVSGCCCHILMVGVGQVAARLGRSQSHISHISQ
jgi:hypothetical protein